MIFLVQFTPAFSRHSLAGTTRCWLVLVDVAFKPVTLFFVTWAALNYSSLQVSVLHVLAACLLNALQQCSNLHSTVCPNLHFTHYI